MQSPVQNFPPRAVCCDLRRSISNWKFSPLRFSVHIVTHQGVIMCTLIGELKMRSITIGLVFMSLLLSAAIFGFFYAWVCSTMWGLDQVDPRVAIKAMQAMNGSVRNAVFAPAFFGTPVALMATAAVLWLAPHKKAAVLFGASGLLYLTCGLILTASVNVPMNQALAEIIVPQNIDAARSIWLEYSATWQFWNICRTVASGLAFLLAVAGAMHLPLFTQR